MQTHVLLDLVKQVLVYESHDGIVATVSICVI